MIFIRSIVKFKAKNRDTSKYIVREIRYNNKALVESLSNGEHYLVLIDDLELIQ